MKDLKIILAQTEAFPGDLDRNLAKMEASLTDLADLIVFPAFSLTGANLKDLYYREDFQKAVEKKLKYFHCKVRCPVLLAGMFGGKLVIKYLTKTDVFTFSSGAVLPLNGVNLGIGINEFINADLSINLSAKPFQKQIKEEILNFPAIEVNLVGGADELVYYGGSRIYDQYGLVKQLTYFENQDYVYVWKKNSIYREKEKLKVYKKEFFWYQALIKGLYDYVQQNHFSGVVLGLSGGIDSALTAAIAVDALGVQKVKIFYLPSKFSSDLSRKIVERLCKNLGLDFKEWSIDEMYCSYLREFDQVLGNYSSVVSENIQARIRANFLMGVANQENLLLLSTGNKSELAMGYATLYGDMAGGFNLLGDFFKTEVYQLANYRNQNELIFPKELFTRPPTAELAFNQKDQDNLPDYGVLDKILEYLISGVPITKLELLFDRKMVLEIYERWLKNVFKRKQASLSLLFSKTVELPITHSFKIVNLYKKY